MYTVTLALTRAWLTDPANPSNTLSCGTRQASQDAVTLDGEFRLFAGNRTQMVSRVLTGYTRSITFAALTAAQMQQILDWRGTLLCLRTIEGDKLYGGYLQVQKSRKYNTSVDGGVTHHSFDCTVTFTQVTYSETV